MAMTEQQVELVIAAQSGDSNSFEWLYSIYYEKIYGFSRMILKNDRDAEDVLQETFITAWRKLNTLESPPTFSVWIQIIAKNLCNMQLRRKNMAILIDSEQEIINIDTQESEELLPAVYAERTDLRDRLSRIIDGLSEVQRQTIVLFYFNELSVEEISRVMECSPGTVKSRLYLARNTIRTEIEEQERQTGEKFCGLAGIPMIPLGKLVRLQVQSLTIGQNVMAVSLKAITSAISDANQMHANEISENISNIKTEGKKMNPKLKLTAKIILVVSIVVVVGVAVIFGVMYAKGGFNKSDLPDTGITDPTEVPDDSEDESVPEDPGITDELDFLWDRLNGYWTNVEQDQYEFVGFFKESDDFRFEYGLLQSGFWVNGNIFEIEITTESTATLTMYVAAVPADSIDGPSPERTEIFYLDTSDLDIDGTIRVQIVFLGNGGWYTYEYAGNSFEEVYENRDQNMSTGAVYDINDLSTAVADIPDKAALDEIYILLEGYWITEDHPFVGFFIDTDENHVVEYGLWQTSWGNNGWIAGGYATGAYEATLLVYFPTVPANEMNDEIPERTEIIYIDIGGLYQDNTIKVKIENLIGLTTDSGFNDNSGWYTYEYGGYTLDEAFHNWYEE